MTLLSRYCTLVSSYPRLFALFITIITLGLSTLSFLTMSPGYVNTGDPTLGFISKGTTIIGREYAKNKVERGYHYWPGRAKLFYNSPNAAEGGDPGTWRRLNSQIDDEDSLEEEYHRTTTATNSIVGGSTRTDFSSATSIFISVDSILNLVEVEALDADGNMIAPSSATLSSTYNSNSAASFCIDQITENPHCHTAIPDDDPWLRIDYSPGALSSLDRIIIYNRPGQQHRINGGTLTVAQGSPTSSTTAKGGGTGLWTSVALTGSQEVYTIFPGTNYDSRFTPPTPFVQHPAPRDFSTATSIFYSIGMTSEYINLREVTAYDSNNNKIEPLSAHLSSIYGNFPELYPQFCIDSNLDTFCHSENQSPAPWLRIDYPHGALASLEKIVIHNRLDCCSDRINGAYVTVTDNPAENLHDALISTLFTSAPLIFPNPQTGSNPNSDPHIYTILPKTDPETEPRDPYLALIDLRQNNDVTCPERSYDGDEHITLLFVHVNENGPVNTPENLHDHSKSVVTAESFKEMCEIEKIVREFRKPNGNRKSYQQCDDVSCVRSCSKEEMYTGGDECCASRKLATPAFLEYDYYVAGDDDNQALNHTWDPFTQDERYFRIPSSCDVFTDEHAHALNDLLRECAQYFEPSSENLLNRCAVAGNIIKKGFKDTEEYFWAWSTSVECIAEIPSKCLRGNGAGMMDTYLSLLPFETSEKLKQGPYPITIARIMIAVTSERGAHEDWKWALQQELQKKFYYMNGKKALNGKSTGTALLGFNLGTKREIFTWYIMQDINYAVIACAVVLILMWWYTNSLRVTLLAFGEILSSLGLGFFLYNTVLRLPHFPFMNATTIFLAIGIGADDVFVYVDSWRHSLKHCRGVDGQPPSKKERLEYSLKHAGMSTFVTSFTTSAAFAANIMSKIVSVKCFGVFAALVILCDYVLMITFLPAVVLNYDTEVCAGEMSRARREVEGEKEANSVFGKAAASVQRLADRARLNFDRFFDTIIPSLILARAPDKEPVRPSSMNGIGSASGKHATAMAAQTFKSTAGPFFWVTFLGTLGIYAIYVAFVNPGLTLPLSASYQLFWDEHPFEVWDMAYSPKFTTASVAGVKYRIQWWWGLSGHDDSNAWDPMDPGEVVTYPIDLYAEESQTALLSFTRDIQAAEFYDKTEALFMDPLIKWVGRGCGIYNSTDDTWDGPSNCCDLEEADFPLERNTFKKCLKKWCNSNGRSAYGQGIYWDSEGEPALVKLKIGTNVDFTSSNPETKKFWDKIVAFEKEKFFNNPLFKLEDNNLSKGWSVAQLTLYDVQQSLANGVKQTLVASLLIAAAVLYITTQSPAVTVVGMLAISCILGWTITVCIGEGETQRGAK
ncbi:hypothetical protein TL16_g11030 [Triparma laevis f. inornata]|uniref:SSD domain-containing protein n=1 Tax=Triparma laevis f. inornata TaxID=1714386 RepID=A0A9W7BJW8_9STRA|nr:hypothetical protein TL16_g11030 [Triparma laevis f. inornata]